MAKILSISIAAYNAEKTIEKCLDSFLSSRYLNELELLVINDGSNDHTEEIVKKYEKIFPESIRLITKKNGGHGSTINTSLQLANGKYYKVLDGDDWVNPVELDKLISCLKISKADLVINDYMEVYNDHAKRVSHRQQYQEYKLYQFDNLFPDDNFRDNIFAMHESTVLTKCLRDIGMHIQEHCFYADTEFLYYTGLVARTVEFNNSCAYQYRLGTSGQSVSDEGIYKHIEDLLKIEYHLIQLYHNDESKIRSEKRRSYLFGIIDTRYYFIFNCYIMIIQKNDKDKLFIKFIEMTKNNYPEITSRCHLSLSYQMVYYFPSVMISWMRSFKKTKIFSWLSNLKHR